MYNGNIYFVFFKRKKERKKEEKMTAQVLHHIICFNVVVAVTYNYYYTLSNVRMTLVQSSGRGKKKSRFISFPGRLQGLSIYAY